MTRKINEKETTQVSISLFERRERDKNNLYNTNNLIAFSEETANKQFLFIYSLGFGVL